jgi:hypothetical protein
VFGGSGGASAALRRWPRSVSSVASNLNCRNKNGLFSRHTRKLQTAAPVKHLAVLDGKRLIVTQSDAGATAVFSLDTLAPVADAEAEAFFAPLDSTWPGYGRLVNPPPRHGLLRRDLG